MGETKFVVQYRWPGTEWDLNNTTHNYDTVAEAKTELDKMVFDEQYSFPNDPVRMEYRIVQVDFKPVVIV
jgi:hypothetical protein